MGQSTIFQEINIDCQKITKIFSTKKLLEILDKFAKFVLFADKNNGELYELNEFCHPTNRLHSTSNESACVFRLMAVRYFETVFSRRSRMSATSFVRKGK